MSSTSATPVSERKSPANFVDPHSEIKAVIEDTFARQRANRWNIANSTAFERIEKLKRLRSAMLRRQGELRDAMHADFRKPAAEVDLTEFQAVLSELGHTISHLKKWMRPQRIATPLTLAGTKSVVRFEPKGVVLILSPWNYPFNLLMSPLVAAIAAGNCVMLRPSDKVPRTSQFMKELIEEVFPQDEVAIFTGPTAIANILLRLPFDHVLFTGSTRIGKQVMAAAAEHLTPVTLELGGQSPVIVDETADLRKAAERIVWGKFLNAGQTCVAPNHVFVHQSCESRFLSELKGAIERSYGTSEEIRKASPDFARIVDDLSQKRLMSMISDSIRAGAKLEIGGSGDLSERYVSPTVLSGVSDDSPAMNEEIFGPILPVLAYKDHGEVLCSIHSRGKPLALYVFSENKANIEQILSHTTAGGTVVNNVVIHLGNPNLPFGGVGESGMGNYHGPFGFRTFSHERALLTQGKFSTVKMFYPPYGPTVTRLLRWLTSFLSR